MAVVTDVLDTLYGQGFRGFLVVNGHGGNIPVEEPLAVRAAIGDGSYGGAYAASDEDLVRLWAAGVTEVRALIETL